MRFSLRTLVIAVVALPPVIAFVWWDMATSGNNVPRSLILVVLIIFVVVTALISGPPRDWQP